jgi:hypothetical protein
MGANGILIIECPMDFAKFWFHWTWYEEVWDEVRARIEAANGK